MGKLEINYVMEGYGKDTEIIYSSYTGGLRILGKNSLKKEYISSYNVIDENNKDSSQYSFWKGALGVAVFGGIGAVAGIEGKNKTSKEYLISIEWKRGEKSLILIDDEYYKIFVKSMF